MRDAGLIIRALSAVSLVNIFVHVKDGAEALEFTFARGIYSPCEAGNVPKIILPDIKMPRVDGIEVLRRIKTNRDTKSIPVVIMTSSKEEQDIVKSYEHGVNSFVVKSVDFKAFSRTVSEPGLYWILANQPPNQQNVTV